MIYYAVKEGLKGFSRARLATLISIITLTLSLSLLSSFTLVTWNANRIVEALRERMEMEIFLTEPFTEPSVEVVKFRIERTGGVQEAQFISKDAAAKIFKEEFGEEINKVLDFNPLPASFKIKLLPDFRNADSAAVVAQHLRTIPGIDEVIYRKTLLELLDRRTRMFASASLASGIVLTIVAIFLVSNTIRLTIYAKRKIITTMKLVGATRMFIRLPFLVEGIMQGVTGGLIAAGTMYAVIQAVLTLGGNELSDIVATGHFFFPVVIGAGTVLGLTGSMISVRKFIKENIE